MANSRVGETGLSDAGPSSQPLAYGITHGTTPAATNFYDPEGAAYFGELEEAFMQGVVGVRSDVDRKPLLSTAPRLPTLEIFPSWPTRFHHLPCGNSQSTESTDSGSGKNNTMSQLESESPVSRKDYSSEQSNEQRQQQQEMMMAASAAGDAMFRTEGEAANHLHKAPDKRRVGGSTSAKDGKPLDAKTLRRLAQNREAAKKSRLRKKAYVQQLESSRIKLTHLEQDLQRSRVQGLFLGSVNANMSPGAAMFDMEYARWLEGNIKHMSELRCGIQSQVGDGELRVIVDECLSHYDDIFRLKGSAVRADVFHLITGMWATPAERCFLWMGGFRPSELLKILMPQLDPLTEQQLVGLCNLTQSSQQAEEALTQGLEQLQSTLADTIAKEPLTDSPDVGNYMGHMALALRKLSNLEGFVKQADNLRQETLHQLRRLLTVRQAARCFLAIGEYYHRLRALSSFWASRPRENLTAADQNTFPTSTDQQILHQPAHSHFSAF